MQIISNDNQQASTRAVRDVQFVSMTYSRTERLHVLLTVSNSRHCIARTYPPAVVDVCELSKEIIVTLK